ncbi:MAG TPA: methyltransferase domain-containing protein [Thermoanaerobaculia bacterium]|jgi:2-polyprenyl-3-methyl-5-hydroxy-6-metoxy-1,4-benzoquinol methylase|nr:methyltransferase domain-containing protein [Thermoanaerobaculia bacterium]
MHRHWLQHEVQARCPLCGVEGEKGAVLSTDHVLPGLPPVTLLRCPACGAAFLQDLTPPDYETGMAEMLDYYVEQGAGIDLIVAPLLRLPPRSIRRCLEVGCSFGFALDFSRHAFGWEVLGVDPSPLAAAGAEALGLPVRRSYFSANLDLGPEPFELAVCSEVLEHIAEPHALLAAIHDRLSPEGLLVLSTPNLALVRPETPEGALGRALSPGLHLVLYDRRALVRVLEQAGFAAVHVEESPETLRAFAARSPAALARLRPADPPAERALLRGYFEARAESAPPASALACGMAYRHFKECVNAGLHDEAAASRTRLARIYRERFDLDLEKPALEAGRRLPFNLTGALFFSGILELNGLRRPDKAAAAFAAAIAAGSLLQESQNPFGLCDGETEALLAQSRKHLPMALAARPAMERERTVREIEAPLRPETGVIAGLAARLFSRLRQRRLLLIAERFVAPIARLSGVVLPLDVIARRPAARLRLVLAIDGADATHDYRAATLSSPPLSPEESLRLHFAPFDAPAGTPFLLGVLDLSGAAEAPLAADLRAVRAVAAGRPPITLACRGEGERTSADPLPDERGIAAFRVAPAGGPAGLGVRAVYRLDAFWCDPHGLYLRGWVHAHEHRVRALRVESAGRSTRVDTFADRPDLLAFYPGHEHVRHSGFAVYLPCPPGHPVHLTLETDGGPASLPLPLPEGPLPPWPASPGDDDGYDVLSPMLRRFVELANARGGRVLQVGSRTPAGLEGMPPRPLLRGPVTGLDIHPGHYVDLVGDAHTLSRFLRERSVDAVVSGSVLEHLQAPWLFAAEVNRVLKPGGLVYHEAPGAWPAHAQPNDFWRMSAEGLRALFGPASGFEVLAARDAGPVAMIPGPQWRQRHLDMPTVPAYAMAEILARKVEEIPPGAVAWPLAVGASEERARRYPVAGLRVAPAPREGPP